MKKPIFFLIVFCVLAVGVLALRDAVVGYQTAKLGNDVMVSVVPGSTVCKTRTCYAKVMYNGKQYRLDVFRDMCNALISGKLKTFECRYYSKSDKLKLVNGREYSILIMMIILLGVLIFLVLKEYINLKR